MATSQSFVLEEKCAPENVPLWKLARQGIQLIINNKAEEADALFKKYPDSNQMWAGYSFAVFMDALMTFEEDKLNIAFSTLKETERRSISNNSWLKSVKSKMFGSDTCLSAAEQLENQIILADTQVCVAILTFLQQDLSGYFKGGWVLRKSWKLYQHAYQEVRNLYKEVIGELPELATPRGASRQLIDEDDTNGVTESEWEFPDEPPSFSYSSPSNGKSIEIDRETIIRLMGAVSFGYGLFHLGISLLPPSLLKITNFLGFGGNRQLGIANLMYAREGTDMRAPLATLALLWYHTIVRPFYAIDGSNVQAGVQAATLLLEESQEEYRDSALFLFFKGRVCRLNSDISSALKAFQASVDNSTQREIKILSLHEVGWCHIIKLDFQAAENTFHLLKQSSRWSRSFYGYLETICSGSCSNIKDFSSLKELKSLCDNGTKGNQLELFLCRRYKCFQDEDETKLKDPVFWRLFVYELLYLWNTLPSCSTQGIRDIIEDCSLVEEHVENEPMPGLAKLIQGCCYCILKQFETGINNFRECLEIRKDLAYNADDAHVSAFSQYELGLLLFKNPETKQEGKTLLSQTSLYKDYDFEQRLTVRIHTILKNE